MENKLELKPKKRAMAAVRIVLLMLLAAAIGMNVYVFNASRVAGVAVPMPFGVGASVVLSDSMRPELSAGDLIIIKPTDEYEVGDVVVFPDGRMTVVHRIVRAEGEEIITRGDANNNEDAPISRDIIIGEVVLAIPLVGYIVNVIKTPIGTVIMLGAALFLLEGSFRREREKDRQSLDLIKKEIERLKREQVSGADGDK